MSRERGKEEPLDEKENQHGAVGEENGAQDKTDDRLAEPEILVKQRDEELARISARLAEGEQLVTDRDQEIATLKQAKAELETRLVKTVAGYKSLVLQANPDIPEELIIGDTIEATEESLSRARTLVDRVKHDLEARISSTRVPGGAPERTVPDLSALSPREKIQYAIGGKR